MEFKELIEKLGFASRGWDQFKFPLFPKEVDDILRAKNLEAGKDYSWVASSVLNIAYDVLDDELINSIEKHRGYGIKVNIHPKEFLKRYSKDIEKHRKKYQIEKINEQYIYLDLPVEVSLDLVLDSIKEINFEESTLEEFEVDKNNHYYNFYYWYIIVRTRGDLYNLTRIFRYFTYKKYHIINPSNNEILAWGWLFD